MLSLAEVEQRHAAGSVNEVEYAQRSALMHGIRVTLDKRPLRR